MKKTLILMLSLSAYSALAQDSVWDALEKRQKDLRETTSVATSQVAVVATETKEAIPGTKKAVCHGDTQESLPLAFVSRLFQEVPAKISVQHDPNLGTLKLTTGGMIDNCSPLLKWNLDKASSGSSLTYMVEAKFQKGSECRKREDGKEVCKYTISKLEAGEVKDQVIEVEPNHRGLEACLKSAGVMTETGINEKAMITTKNIEEFSGVKESGDLVFVSTGKPLSNTKSKYGADYIKTEGCTKYENIAENPVKLISIEEELKLAKEAEAAKLVKDCTADNYYKLTEFIDKYEEYSSDMEKLRNNLIVEAAKKAAQNIADGKYTNDDLKVIADFEKYIVDPKVNEARELYNQVKVLEGDAKKAKQEELKLVLAELKKLNSKPYFTAGNVQTLLKDGKFEEAEAVNSMKLVMQHNSSLGVKTNNVVMTPELAMVNIVAAQKQFQAGLPSEVEKYEIRTGQSSGQTALYTQLSSKMTENIKTRTQNYSKEIQIEMACMTNSLQGKQICTAAGGKFCYAGWFRNATKCIQEGQQQIAFLQEQLQHFNKVDQERSTEYAEKAAEYSKLEEEGRRYIAAQNGEEYVETPVVAPRAPADTTIPPRRESTTESPVYTFDYNQGQMPQQPYQQQQNNQYANPSYNPWAQYSGAPSAYPNMNNNYMGQQNFSMNGQYGFNWNGGMSQSMNNNSGYWGQPYQAYSNYNMYGFR